MKKSYLSSLAAIAIWSGLAGIAFAESERIPASPRIEGSSSVILDISGGDYPGNDFSFRRQDNVPGSWNTNLDISLSLNPPSASRLPDSGNAGIYSGTLPDGIHADGSLLFNIRPASGPSDSADAFNSSNQWSLLLEQIAASDRTRLSNGVTTIGSVPEPGTMALLGLGLAGLVAASFRKRN